MKLNPVRRLALALTMAAALTTSACGNQEAPAAGSGSGEIAVSDAWVRATTGTDDPTMSAAFMVVENSTGADIRLVSATSPVAGMVQIHEMAPGDDGHMVMQQAADGVTVRAGKQQLLAPGGYHVMLMGLTRELAPGDEVDLSLEFSDGTTVAVTAPVKEFTEEEGHYHSDSPGMGDSMSPSESS